MQKVSKQSLAMIALSILLAISIALTFTFAGLQDSKTAKGTITFTGNVSLVMTHSENSFTGTGTSVDPYAFTISNAASKDDINNELAKISFKLGTNSQAAYIKVEASVTTGQTAVTLKTKTLANYEPDSLIQKTTNGNQMTTSTSAVKLSDLYEADLDLTKLDASSGSISDVEITFTVTANTKLSNL